MFFQVVISPKFIKDYFYCLTNQKCVQSFICILGECLLTRFSNILGFWIQDEAGDTDPWLLPLSLSPNLFCWLLWPLRPGDPVTDSFLCCLISRLKSFITDSRLWKFFPFHPLLEYVNIWNETTQKNFQRRDDVWNDWLHLASKLITSKEIIIYVIAHQFICSFCCLGITGARRLSMVAIFLTDKTFFSLIYQKFRLIIKSC